MCVRRRGEQEGRRGRGEARPIFGAIRCREGRCVRYTLCATYVPTLPLTFMRASRTRNARSACTRVCGVPLNGSSWSHSAVCRACGRGGRSCRGAGEGEGEGRDRARQNEGSWTVRAAFPNSARSVRAIEHGDLLLLAFSQGAAESDGDAAQLGMLDQMLGKTKDKADFKRAFMRPLGRFQPDPHPKPARRLRRGFAPVIFSWRATLQLAD